MVAHVPVHFVVACKVLGRDRRGVVPVLGCADVLRILEAVDESARAAVDGRKDLGRRERRRGVGRG